MLSLCPHAYFRTLFPLKSLAALKLRQITVVAESWMEPQMAQLNDLARNYAISIDLFVKTTRIKGTPTLQDKENYRLQLQSLVNSGVKTVSLLKTEFFFRLD